MHKDFLEIQRIETRRILFVSAMLLLFYFLIFCAIAAVFQFFWYGMTTPSILEAARYGIMVSMGLLVFQLWFANRYGLQILLDMLGAEEPDPEDAYHMRFVKLVEEVGVAAGGFRPKPMILPTPAMNALALSDRRGMILGATEGLVSRLNRAQTQAVIAHELAHMLSGDCRIATWLYAMFSPLLTLADLLDKWLQDDSKDNQPSLSALMEWVLLLLTLFISRSRELRADARAVELTRNPSALVEALLVMGNGNHCIGGTGDVLSPICILPSQISDSASGLFSSHPRLDQRIQPLLAMCHEDFESIAGRIAGPASPPVFSKLSDENAKYRIQTESGWSAPMLATEMLASGIFTVQSWIKTENEEGDGAPAFTYPSIRRLMQSVKEKTPNGACPICRCPMVETILEGVPIAVCQERHGMLVLEKRVGRILARREDVLTPKQRAQARQWFIDHQFRLRPKEALAQTPPVNCPICGMEMFRSFFSYQYHLPVDRCFECKRVWFDASEIDLLQALLEGAAADLEKKI